MHGASCHTKDRCYTGIDRYRKLRLSYVNSLYGLNIGIAEDMNFRNMAAV